MPFSDFAVRGRNVALSLATILSLSSVALAGPAVLDASFESTDVGGYYAYQPSSDWTFSASAGVAATGQPGFAPWFTAAPPDGSQAAFLQNTATISQDVTGFTPGNQYQVSFYVAARPSYTSNPVTVSLGGTDLGTATTDDPSQFSQYQSDVFTATAETETLSFQTFGVVGSSDADTALDMVSIDDVTGKVSATPEPGNLAYLSPLLLGAAAWVRRRSKKA